MVKSTFGKTGYAFCVSEAEISGCRASTRHDCEGLNRTRVLQLLGVLLRDDARQIQRSRALQQERSRIDQLLNRVHGFEEARLNVADEQRSIGCQKTRKHRIKVAIASAIAGDKNRAHFALPRKRLPTMPTSLYIMVNEARGLPAIDRKRKTTDW